MCKTKELTLLSRIGHNKQANLEGREEKVRNKPNSKKSRMLVRIAKRHHTIKAEKTKQAHDIDTEYRGTLFGYYERFFLVEA